MRRVQDNSALTVRGNTLYPASHLDLPLRPLDTQLILKRIAAIAQRFEENRRAIAAVHEPFATEQRTSGPDTQREGGLVTLRQ